MTTEFRNAEGLAEPPGYTHVAVARGTHTVYTAGAVPLDSRGDLVGPNDLVAQTEQVIANLLEQLETGGAAAADVVKTTVYVVGADEALNTVWHVVQASPIASAPSTLLGVALLGYTGQLVEIEAIAVITLD